MALGSTSTEKEVEQVENEEMLAELLTKNLFSEEEEEQMDEMSDHLEDTLVQAKLELRLAAFALDTDQRKILDLIENNDEVRLEYHKAVSKKENLFTVTAGKALGLHPYWTVDGYWFAEKTDGLAPWLKHLRDRVIRREQVT